MNLSQWILQTFNKDPIQFLLDTHLAETVAVTLAAVAGLRTVARASLGWTRARRLPLALQERLKEAARFYVDPHCLTTDPDLHNALDTSSRNQNRIDLIIAWSRRLRARGLPRRFLILLWKTEQGLSRLHARIKKLESHDDIDGTASRRKAIPIIERSFRPGSRTSRTIVLASAGMGKSALLYNIYLRHSRTFFRRYRMQLVDLGARDALSKIEQIEAKSETVLLLDALDENSDAIEDYEGTLRQLNAITSTFYRVVLTCRTQFIATEESLPRLFSSRGGVARAGDPNLNSSPTIFLALLSRRQLNSYLRGRFLFGFLRGDIGAALSYRRARTLAALGPEMVVRPMLMAYLEYLLEDASGNYRYSYQVYEAMIRGWLLRRKTDDLDPDFEAGYRFVAALALDLIRNYSKRGGYHISMPEAEQIALAENSDLKKWQISGRSLLVRDTDGMLKFAHLTIMEVLAARRIVETKIDIGDWRITEQTRRFVAEIVVGERFIHRADLSGITLEKISMSGVSLQSGKMTRSHFREVDVSGANFEGADLQEVDFEFIDFSQTKLDHANFSGSNLKGIRLEDAQVSGVNFSSCDLTGAEFSNTTFTDSIFVNARLVGANLTAAKFVGCAFESARLNEVRVYRDEANELNALPLFQRSTVSIDTVLPSDWQSAFQGDFLGSASVDSRTCDTRRLDGSSWPMH